MRVYSPDFTYLYRVTTFQKMQEIKRYVGKSVLTLVLSPADDAAYYLQRNSWIVTDEPYIVKHIAQGMDEITITAYGGHQLLTQRVVLPPAGEYALSHTGSADAVVKQFITQSIRGLPLAAAAPQGGTIISDQSRLKPLGDEVARILSGSGRGEKYTFDAPNKRIVFDSYLGTDRSRGNPFDNPPVIFDLKYKNIDDYTYTEDATAEQTTAYVGGQGEGVDREIIVTGNDATGIDRTEIFVDARDVVQGDITKLTERAAQSTIPTAYTISAGAVADAGLVYGVDYNLGDTVTTNVPVKRYTKTGDYYDPIETTIQVNQRITEVTITREGGEENIDLTFGEQPITQTQIQKIRAEVAQLKASEPRGAWRLYAGLEELGLSAPASLSDICAAMSDRSMILLDESQIAAVDRPVSIIATYIIHRYTAWRTSITFTSAGTGTTIYYDYMYVTHWRGDTGLNAWRRVALAGGELLWSGSWSSGSITVPGLNKYWMISLEISGINVPLIAIKHSNGFSLRGGNFGTYASGNLDTYHVSLNYSGGTTLDFTAANYLRHTPSGNHGASGTSTIVAIYGVI